MSPMSCHSRHILSCSPVCLCHCFLFFPRPGPGSSPLCQTPGEALLPLLTLCRVTSGLTEMASSEVRGAMIQRQSSDYTHNDDWDPNADKKEFLI